MQKQQIEQVVRIAEQVIPPEVRSVAGDSAAWNLAVSKLKKKYIEICGAWLGEKLQPTMKLTLTLDKPVKPEGESDVSNL